MNFGSSMRQPFEKQHTDLLCQTDESWEIVLFNDDVNTFEHVIECLIKCCGHNILQAEQCALIAHCKGKCTVKTGLYARLLKPCRKLLDEGLTAKLIQQ